VLVLVVGNDVLPNNTFIKGPKALKEIAPNKIAKIFVKKYNAIFPL
jgi:hypothetical protein